MFYRLSIIVFLFTLSACQQPTSVKEEPSRASLTTIPLQYASNFSIQKNGTLTILSVGKAWNGQNAPDLQYVLYPKTEKAPSGFGNAVLVPVPVDRIICTGTTQTAILDFLAASDRIVAIADGKYLYNPSIQKRIEDGTLPELGTEQGLNYEKALAVKPELVFSFSNGGNRPHQKFTELGIPVVMIAEFMEETPLGKAEWVKFFAYFLGKEESANSNFQAMAQRYETLKKEFSTVSSEKKPSVFTGTLQGSAWHVPGGKSFMARFIEDAGGQYLWADNEDAGALALDFETVLNKAQKADIWLNVILANSRKDLLATDERYQYFQAFAQSKIYSYTARISKNGGYDFFESAIVRPDVVLQDLIHIFHPAALPNHKLFYYKHLP